MPDMDWGRQWTPNEIAELVLDVYGTADWNAINMVAVALAESGGWEKAVNIVDHDPRSMAYNSLDVGMWQVNTFWHGRFCPLSVSLVARSQALYVLQLARRLGGWKLDWSLWTSWKNDTALRHMGTARHAVNAVSGVAPL